MPYYRADAMHEHWIAERCVIVLLAYHQELCRPVGSSPTLGVPVDVITYIDKERVPVTVY